MPKKPTIQNPPQPSFRTATASVIQCDLCPSRAYSGTKLSEPAPDLLDAIFAGRGWKLYRNDTWGQLQVCARCARKLSDRWTEIPVPVQDKDARA